MSKLVNVETGEIVTHCTPEEARRITEAIRTSADALWALLTEAHEKGAWLALGYETFESYVNNEFSMSKVHAYRLLNQGQVIKALSAGGVTHGLPSERQARELADLKGEPERMNDVWKATVERKNGNPTAKDLREAVADIVAEEAEKHAQRAEDRAANRDLASKAERAGLDMDDERMRQRGEFSRLCRDIAALPDPVTFIEYQGEHLRERHGEQAIDAHAWLTTFVKLWRER